MYLKKDFEAEVNRKERNLEGGPATLIARNDATKNLSKKGRRLPQQENK